VFSSCSKAPAPDQNPEQTWAKTAEFIELESAGMVTVTFQKATVNHKKIEGEPTFKAINVEFPNNSILDVSESLKEISINSTENKFEPNTGFLFFEMETDFGTIMAYAGPDDLNKIKQETVQVDSTSTMTTTFYKVRSIPYVFKKDVPASFLMQEKKFVKYNAGFVQKSTITADRKVVTPKDGPVAPPEKGGNSWIFFVILGVVMIVLLILWATGVFKKKETDDIPPADTH